MHWASFFFGGVTGYGVALVIGAVQAIVTWWPSRNDNPKVRGEPNPPRTMGKYDWA